MRLPLSAYLVCQAADAITFAVVALPFGASGEENPMIRYLADTIGVIPAAILPKVIAAIGVVLVARFLTKIGHSRLATFGLLWGAAWGLIGATSNLASLWVLTH